MIDIDFPEKASMWFYTTASRTQMVITGPTSRENSESLLEQGDAVYSKEFFDTWSNPAPASTKVGSFASLSPARKAFIEDISRWWEDVIFMSKGDRGEHNVFDDDTDFMALAKLIQNSSEPASHKNPHLQHKRLRDLQSNDEQDSITWMAIVMYSKESLMSLSGPGCC